MSSWRRPQALIRFGLILGCLLLASTSHAGAAPSRDRILTLYPLEALDAAANALRVIVDLPSGVEPSSRGLCEISMEDALRLTQPLKDLIDTRIEGWWRGQSTATPKLFTSSKDCADECQCGLAASILGTREAALGVDAKAELKRLREIAAQQDFKQSLRCARWQSWFCESPLMTYLKQSAGAPSE